MSYKDRRNSKYGDIYDYDNSRQVNRNIPKKKKNLRIALYTLFIVFSLIFMFTGGAFIYAHSMLGNINYSSNEDDNAEEDYISTDERDPKVLNVALFGVDRYTGDGEEKSRSDTILILSLDSRREKIKLLSIMRDTFVKIPGYKDNRINVAIALGGEKLAVKTIENNFGVKIDRYCTVDCESFKEIIDIMGGIDVELTAKEAQHINKLGYELNAFLVKEGKEKYNITTIPEKDGEYHLSGIQALHYARSRKVPTASGLSDDFARTYRQRKVISLVINKMRSCNISQILGIIEKAGPYIKTNFNKNEIVSLAKNSLKYIKYDIEELRIPDLHNVRNENKNGASVLVIPDESKAKYDIAKFIYEDSVQN